MQRTRHEHNAQISAEKAPARRALLLAGGEAVLARASAATCWDLDGFRPGVLPIELNAPASRGGRTRVPVRRTRPLEPPALVDGLLVTGVGQTLVELGSTALTYHHVVHQPDTAAGIVRDLLAQAG